MGFDIADLGALRAADAFQRADLIEQHVLHLVRAASHGAAPETGQVRVGRVRTDHYLVLCGQGHCAAHDLRVRRVKSTSYVCTIDERHDFGVQAHCPGPETLADIAIK